MRAYLKKESKNLFSTSFGVSNSNGTFNKLTINNDNSMSIELNGFKPYSGAAMWNRTLNAGTYTISFLSTIINTPADATQNNNVLYIVFGSTFYNLVRLGGDQTKKYWTYKIVVPNDNTVVHLRWYTHLQDGVTYSNYSATFENIMINEGETAIAYEPYGKNYQEIKALYGELNSSRNLLNKDNYICDSSGNIGIDVSHLIIGETYTFSCDTDDIQMFKINRTQNGVNSEGVFHYPISDRKYTFTMKNAYPNEKVYLFLSYDWQGNKDLDLFKSWNVQIEKGTIATEYEPYKSYPTKDIKNGLIKNPKNLFNILNVETDPYSNGVGGVWNNGDGTLTLGAQYYQNSAKNTLRKICPSLKEGDTVTLFFKTESPISKFIYCAPSTWSSGTSRTLTTEMLDSGLGFYGHHPNNPDLYETPCLTWDWQIVKGTEEVPMYIPQLFNINIKE